MLTIFFFIISATLVVIFATRLAKTAEVIDYNTKLSPALIGVIVAVSTSLPELATGFTSLFLGQEEMVISNVLGSNLFNLIILAVFNVWFIKSNIFCKIKKSLNEILLFSLIMYINFFITSVIFRDGLINRFDGGSIIIIVVYVIAIKIINSTPGPQNLEVENDPTQKCKIEDKVQESELERSDKEMQKEYINFMIYSLIILVSSILIAKSAGGIVTLTGMSASVVGALFIGVTTSLPEFATCYALIKKKSYIIAFSSVLSSNLFNFFILALIDVISPTNIYNSMECILVGYVLLGILFIIIYFVQSNIKKINKVLSFMLSLFIIIVYISYFLIAIVK